MANPAENVAKLKQAYAEWDRTKGRSVDVWLQLFAEDVRFRSLAGGAPGLEFTRESRSRQELKRYFEGLGQEWEMVHYTPEEFTAQDDRVVMRGSTAWRHRKTGNVFDTPKADFFTFRDGQVVDFFEFYDTAQVIAATR
jgi:ketosteroid isomerase-like protein